MSKKVYLLALLTLVLIPMVTATIGEGIENTLGAIFDATEDLAYIKAGIWLILFFIVFKSAERIFPNNRGAAMIIALVISMIGARFMPDEYLEYIGGGYSIILIIILLLVPFFLGSMIGDMLRWGRTGKTFLILLFYGGFVYFLREWEEIGIISGVLGTAVTWMADNRIIVYAIIGIIALYMLFRRGGGGGYPSSGGGGGPSFWRGLGRGAGATAAWGSRGLTGWLARRRALAQQRALAKSVPIIKQQGIIPRTGPTDAERLAWRQKRLEGVQSQLKGMPGGKAIARGTEGWKRLISLRRRQSVLQAKLGQQPDLVEYREHLEKKKLRRQQQQ